MLFRIPDPFYEHDEGKTQCIPGLITLSLMHHSDQGLHCLLGMDNDHD